MADFPTVPIAPGVPALPREAGVSAFLPALMTGDLVLGLGLVGPQWGVFSGGSPILVPDNIVDFGFRNTAAIMDYPLEEGAFGTYNKVANPFDTKVRMTVGRSEAARQAFLAEVDAVQKSLDLFDVVTPSKTYTSVNVVHYDYNQRAERGVGLLTVDLWLREVRVTATSSFSNTQSPSGASPQNGGAPQTATPPPADAAQLPAVR